ncbi:MAG: hypothetical protein OEW29_19500 [Acidimicrobiia bacterium]|nr:hypothetical protein [Acidimicrobiia bacterium]
MWKLADTCEVPGWLLNVHDTRNALCDAVCAGYKPISAPASVLFLQPFSAGVPAASAVPVPISGTTNAVASAAAIRRDLNLFIRWFPP